MSSIKGFPSSDKITSGGVPRQGYATIQPSDDKRFGLDTVNRAMNVFGQAFPIEVGSTQNIIVSTAHPMEQGDVVRFKTAPLNGKEVSVIEIIDANTFKLGEFLRQDPTGGTFDAGRYVTPAVDADGAIAVGGAVGGTEVAEFNAVLPIVLTGTTTLLQTDENARLLNAPQGQFNAILPTLLDTEFGTLQSDFRARLLNVTQAQYNVTPPVILDTEYTALQIDVNGRVLTSTSVTQATDVVLTTFFDYGVTPVDDANWIQIVADTGLQPFTQMDIFDSSGETLELAVGGVAAEVRKLLISPGGNGLIPAQIPINSRLSIRAITGSPISSGNLVVNYVG